MLDQTQTQRLQEQVEEIIQHLNVESKYLDSVIESSREMQSILRERGSASAKPASASQPNETSPESSHHAERNKRLKQKLDQLKNDIAREFLPILEGRKRLLEVIRSLDPKHETTPSVTTLALLVDEPQRSKLKKLRSEIRNKLHQVQSISMGSQALLIYTLDFYNRLLTGLSQDYRQSNYYNAQGQTQNQFAGSLIKTNC